MNPTLRRRIVGAIVLTAALCWFWLPQAELASDSEPDLGTGSSTPEPRDAPSSRRAQKPTLSPKIEANKESFTKLASAFPGKLAVLHCALEGPLDPDYDLMVPGGMYCSTALSFPYSVTDGWLTTVVPTPHGRAGICDDWDPITYWKEANWTAKEKEVDRGLVWENAGTQAAHCRFVEKTISTVVVTLSAPRENGDGQRYAYWINPDCGEALTTGWADWPYTPSDGTSVQGKVTITHFAEEEQNHCRLMVSASFEDETQKSQLIRLESIDLDIDPARDQTLTLHYSDADLSAAAAAADEPPPAEQTLRVRSDEIDALLKSSDSHPAADLLRAMRVERTRNEVGKNERAWKDYDETRARWIEEQLETTTMTAAEAEDAFDQHWQDQLDRKLEDANAVNPHGFDGYELDATGRWVDAEGKRHGF